MKAALAVTIITSTIAGSTTAQEYNRINKLRGVSAAEGAWTIARLENQIFW